MAYPIMDLSKICRMCSSEHVSVRSIFYDYTDLRLPQTISEVLRLEISLADGLPTNICEPCVGILTKMKHLVDQFRANERALRQRIFGMVFGGDNTTYAAGAMNSGLIFKEVPVNSVNPCITTQPTQQYVPALVPPVTQNHAIPEVKEEEESDSSSDDDSDCDGSAPNGQKRANSKPDFKCYICKSESLGTSKALADHLAAAHSGLVPQTCTECITEPIVLRDVRALNSHRRMHSQPIKCEYCDRRYGDYHGRDEHVRLYHLGEGAPCPSPCQQCGKICKSVAALKSHMRNHKQDVRCDQCGKVFHKQHKLQEHVKWFHGPQPERHQCNICNKVLHTLASYNSHLKLHNEDKNYSCDLCPLKFYTAANLRTHKRVHQKNANYKPKKDWTGHYTVARAADGSKMYSCNLCGKTATGYINTIISHVRLHFKEVRCDQCDLKFTFVNQLKAHYVVHTRERNFKCNYCEKDFMYDSHMRHHIKQAHPAEREAERAAAAARKKLAQAHSRGAVH